MSLGPSLIAQVSPIREIGVRNGTFFLFVAVAGLTGNPIGGALVSDNSTDFTNLQIFCGVTMVVGASIYAASRYIQAGIKWQVI